MLTTSLLAPPDFQTFLQLLHTLALTLSYPVLRLFVIEFFPFTLSDCLSAAVLSTSFFYVPGLLEPLGWGPPQILVDMLTLFQTGDRLFLPDFYLPPVVTDLSTALCTYLQIFT